MNTVIRSTIGLGIGLLLFPIAAMGQHHGAPGIPGRTPVPEPSRPAPDGRSGKSTDMMLRLPTRVAGIVLEPGRYRIGMQSEGAAHVLVVRARNGTRDRGGVDARTEAARVPCEVVDTDSKVSSTAIHLRPEADGTQTLSGIAIKGEHGKHVIAAPPAM